MENGAIEIGEDVRKDKERISEPRPETPALIDMDNPEAFRPVPVCFN